MQQGHVSITFSLRAPSNMVDIQPAEEFPAQAENVCIALSTQLGKDTCLYTHLRVPTDEQVRLVVRKSNGTLRPVKQSCFSSIEALQLFLKEVGKRFGQTDAAVNCLLLVNGATKVDKARANTVRQVVAARGKCSPFMSADELKELEAKRQAFIDGEKQKAAEAAEKAKAEKKEAKKPAESEPVVEGEEKPKKKRAPKRKAEESTEVVAAGDWCGCSGPVEPVADVKEPSPKAKRVKKPKAEKKPAEILGQAPEESLSAQVPWCGMAQ